MNVFIDQDWRKQASLTATNDLDIEKAFSDQASGFVENKVGDLMKDQYRIGFEIVKKNDENTRMVGIFAFKVEKDLLFAPVFFINGEIKGPLLYRCNTKTFVPANKDWSTYLIESMEMDEGKGRDRSRRSDSAPLVQMQRITFRPPGLRKGASVKEENIPVKMKEKPAPTPDANGTYKLKDEQGDATDNKKPKLSNGESVLKMAAWEDGTIRVELNGEHHPLTVHDADYILKAAGDESITISIPGQPEFTIAASGISQIKKAFFTDIPDNAGKWADGMLELIEKSSSEKGLIREFLGEVDYGQPAAELIIKAASGKEGYGFANMLAGIYGTPDELIPDTFLTSKKAAEEESPELVIHYTTDGLDKEAAVSKEFFADGFFVQDKRPEETMSVVWDTFPSTLGSPSEAGEYSVLKNDGQFLEGAFVAQAYQGYFGSSSLDGSRMRMSNREIVGDTSDERSIPAYIVIHNGKVCITPAVMTVFQKGSKDTDLLKDTVEEKKAYYIYITKSDCLIGPVGIDSIKTVDGVKYCKASYNNHYDADCHDNSNFNTYYKAPLTINPELAQSDIEEAVLGSDAKFIEVEVDYDEDRTNYPSKRKAWDDGAVLEITRLDDIGSSYSVDNWIFSTWSIPKVTVMREVNAEKQASYRISDGHRVSGPMNKCVTLVKLARDMGIYAKKAYELIADANKDGERSFYLQPTEKVASRLHVVDRPNFDEEFDSEFGIPLQPSRSYALRVQGDQEKEPPSAIGDAMNPTSTTGLPNLTVATTSPEDLRALADTYHLPHVFEHGVIGTLADTFNSVVLLDKYIPKLEDGVDALGRIKFLLHWCPTDFEKAYGSDDMTNLEAEIDSNFEAQGAVLLKLLKKSDKQKKHSENQTFTMP